jgi:predicted nucleotidyltransferase
VDARLAAIAARLASVPALRFAALFGSAAAGRATPGSDLDVGLSFEHRRSPGFAAQLALAADLSRDSGRDVDLVVLEEAGTVLRREVALRGRLVWERAPGAFARFRCGLAVEWEDFAPFFETCRRGFLQAVIRKGERRGE